jgi:hypothetical protein
MKKPEVENLLELSLLGNAEFVLFNMRSSVLYARGIEIMYRCILKKKQANCSYILWKKKDSTKKCMM